MSLYEYSLFNIFNQLNNDKISYQELEDLPEDILNDLDRYLIHVDEPYENFIETAFYVSLKLKHLIFTKYFLKEITNNIDDFDYFISILNNGLSYATDIGSVEFLIKFGANDWNKGLLGSIDNNNMIMIEYFIKLGADDFNSAMIKATLNSNKKLINYFIDLGAKDFNDGLYAATQISNMKLIKFFIEKGATDFDGGLYTAARYGLDNLILFYINLGANDYLTALGAAIDNNHFNDLLIPSFQKNKIKPCVVGEAFLYFLKHTKFESRSGISINHLIPFLLDGYTTRETLKLLMKLYVYNIKLNYEENEYNDDSYYIAFGEMPSLNKKVVQNKKITLTLNNNQNTTFDNIKEYHNGFQKNYIDRIYIPDIIELNVYGNLNLSKKDKLLLTNPETMKQLWNELMIIKSVVDFYD